MNLLWSTLLVVVAAAALVQGASTPEFQAQIRPVAEGCKAEVKATDEDVENVVNLNTELSHEGKCLVGCVLGKIGLAKDNKIVTYKENSKVYDSLLANDPEKGKHLDTEVDKCIEKGNSENPSDHCAAANTAFVCFLAAVA